MPMLRSFLALLAGFAAMAALVTIVTAALMKLAPAWVDYVRQNTSDPEYQLILKQGGL